MVLPGFRRSFATFWFAFAFCAVSCAVWPFLAWFVHFFDVVSPGFRGSFTAFWLGFAFLCGFVCGVSIFGLVCPFFDAVLPDFRRSFVTFWFGFAFLCGLAFGAVLPILRRVRRQHIKCLKKRIFKKRIYLFRLRPFYAAPALDVPFGRAKGLFFAFEFFGFCLKYALLLFKPLCLVALFQPLFFVALCRPLGFAALCFEPCLSHLKGCSSGGAGSFTMLYILQKSI